ncbi:hypothetical protein K474DRAFT_1707790 [Panus rudis PR-1116 ss-1]|nr:hypothetical protein K474DRAFT_1707790 [Panus rudis PR-1116 ss-1]
MHTPTRRSVSHSPVPRISNLLPRTKGNDNKPYSPASRAQDISRLLDPAYASASTASTSPGLESRAYVDHRGDLHDPDYRDFPVMPVRRSTTMSKTRARRRLSVGSSYSAEYYNGRLSTNSARPRWERSWENDDDVDEEDEEDDRTFESASRFSPFVSEQRTRRIQHRHYPQSLYLGEQTPISTSPASFYLDRDEDNTPGQSQNGSPASETILGEDGEQDKTPVRSKSRSKSLRRNLRPLLCRSPSTKVANVDINEKTHSDASETRTVDENDFVPTCTYKLRRRWQAISLRVRFSIFRAKRRLRRVIK